jgi:hypothetical protein
MAFLNMARDFQAAADIVSLKGGSLGGPVYFLYFHALELALKAFLRSHNIRILDTKRRGHNLTDLYEECRGLGLTIGPDDGTDINNVMRLLEGGNKYQGFRYFNLESVTIPDLSWTRATVRRLMQVVEQRVESTSEKNTVAVRGGKGIVVLGKPVNK